MRLAVYGHVCMDQLIGQMRNPQYRQQPVNDQLVHAFMPNDAACFIKSLKAYSKSLFRRVRSTLSEKNRQSPKNCGW